MQVVGRSVWHLVAGMSVVLRRIRFVFPAPSIVQLHPVIFSVFNIASVFQSLCEEVPKVVIVGCVLESKIPHVGEILVELLCVIVSIIFKENGDRRQLPG
jgi:hypothetical protein